MSLRLRDTTLSRLLNPTTSKPQIYWILNPGLMDQAAVIKPSSPLIKFIFHNWYQSNQSDDQSVSASWRQMELLVPSKPASSGVNQPHGKFGWNPTKIRQKSDKNSDKNSKLIEYEREFLAWDGWFTWSQSRMNDISPYLCEFIVAADAVDSQRHLPVDADTACDRFLPVAGVRQDAHHSVTSFTMSIDQFRFLGDSHRFLAILRDSWDLPRKFSLLKRGSIIHDGRKPRP